MNIIRVGTDHYHHQSGHKALTPEFVAAINPAVLADHLLREEWKGQCEIVTDYMPKFPSKDTRQRLVVRIKIRSSNPCHEEESYSYLRHSCGPRQGWFWDIYGDDLHSVELAIIAIHQAPAPIYSGALVFKMGLNPTTP